MKKNQSKASLKNESQQVKATLSSSIVSQPKRLLTESSMFMIGNNANSSNQQLTISNYSDSNQKQNGLQQRISNSQIYEDRKPRNDQYGNQNSKQFYPSNCIARLEYQNNENTQSMNVPQLTFVSSNKIKVTQKNNNQGPPVSTKNEIKKRTSSIEKLGYTKVQQQQQQIQGIQFDEMVKRTSLGSIDTLSSVEKKRMEKSNTPISYNTNQNTNANTPSKYNSAQKRNSIYDLNQSRNRNTLENSSYISTNCHNNCLLSYSQSQYPNKQKRESSSSAKRNKKNEYENSGYSNSNQKCRPVDSTSKNSFISKSVGRVGPNISSINVSQHSSNSNQQQNMNCYQINNPFFQQGVSCYSSINIKDLINNEKFDNNDKLQNNDKIEDKNILQNNVKYLKNDQFQNKQIDHKDNINEKTEINTDDNNIQSSNIFEIDIDSLKSDLINQENKILQEKEKSTNKQQQNDLQKENEQLKEICISLENENSKIRAIMEEQEEIIKKMKDLQSSSIQNKCNSCNNEITQQQNESQGQDNSKTADTNQLSEFDSNQLIIKTQDYQIKINILQENIKELEYKNKELQDDVHNFILQKVQLEQEIMKMHSNFMEQQKVIHELTVNVQKIHYSYLPTEEVQENTKHSKIKLISSNNPILIEKDQLQAQSPKKIKSSTNLQNPVELSKSQSIPLPIDMAYIQKSKIDSDNQSLIYKIEDLESQLNQVYKSLNSSPQKQQGVHFNFNVQREKQDNKIQLFNNNQLYHSSGQIFQSQLLNDQLITFEMVKQQQLEIENLKNEIKTYKNQLILWQERYNNLEKVHQSLLIEKTSSSTVQINQIEINTEAANTEKLRDYVIILARQIEDMDQQIKDQNSEIAILKMNIQQKNIELQDQQLKLDSKETMQQMIRKRINELEEQNVTSESQKGQLKVQVKQLEDLFNNQKFELQQVYKLLKTRNMDADDIQKQHDEYLNQTRNQQIAIQVYEQKIEDLVQKNNNLQNQLYEFIHQQATTTSENNLLLLQKEMNQNIINSLAEAKPYGQPTQKFCNYEDLMRNNKQQELLTSMNHKFSGQEVYSSESILYSNPNVVPIGRYSTENPTFGSLNNIKNNQSENQSSKDHHSSSQQNQFSFQNKINPIQIHQTNQTSSINNNN